TRKWIIVDDIDIGPAQLRVSEPPPQVGESTQNCQWPRQAALRRLYRKRCVGSRTQFAGYGRGGIIDPRKDLCRPTLIGKPVEINVAEMSGKMNIHRLIANKRNP